MTEMEMGIGLFLCNNIVSSVKIIKVQLQRISVGFKGVDLRFLLHFKNSDSPSVLAAYSQAPARGRLWVTVQVRAGSCGSRSIRGEMIVSRLWGHRPPPAPRTQGDQNKPIGAFQGRDRAWDAECRRPSLSIFFE